jgi:hypothetical protein
MLGYFLEHAGACKQALERYTVVGNLQQDDVDYLLQHPDEAARYLYKVAPARIGGPDPWSRTYLQHHRGPVDYSSPQAQQLFAVQKAALQGSPEITAYAEVAGYPRHGMGDGDPFVPMVMSVFLRTGQSTNMTFARKALVDWVLWLARNPGNLPEGVPACGLFDAHLDKLARAAYPDNIRAMVMAWGREGIPIPDALKRATAPEFLAQLKQDWQESAPATV